MTAPEAFAKPQPNPALRTGVKRKKAVLGTGHGCEKVMGHQLAWQADDLGLVVSPYMGSIADSREQPKIGKVAPQRMLWRRKQITILF